MIFVAFKVQSGYVEFSAISAFRLENKVQSFIPSPLMYIIGILLFCFFVNCEF